MTLALVLGAILAVLAVLAVARPFLYDPVPSSDRLDERDELEGRRIELAEERDRALAALKELEFDHRTGKISDDDYRGLVGPYRRRAAEALRALDARTSRGRDRFAAGGRVPGGVVRAERIRPGQLEVQPTDMVQVPEPYPPPDEGSPPAPAPVPEPTPAPVPEPYPPPDEGTPPSVPDVPEPGPLGPGDARQ